LKIKRSGDFFVFPRQSENPSEYPPKTGLLPSYYRVDFSEKRPDIHFDIQSKMLT
jgi:hypothetical protein